MPLPRIPSVLVPSLAFVALTIPACVDPAATRPVLAQQAETLSRIERACAHDSAALATLTDSLLDAQRERLLTRLELERLDALDITDPSARGAPLQDLPEVRAFDAGARALRAALGSRAVAKAALLSEAIADNAALSGAAGARADLAQVSREAATHLWREAVLERIDDPDARDAAARLLRNLLNPSN